MSTFDVIARRAIVEADLARYEITPEYVLVSWLKSRYREIINELAFANLNKIADYAFVTTVQTQGTDASVANGVATLTSPIGGFVVGMVGKFVRVSLDNEWYRITAVPTANTLTFDTTYANTTKSGVAFRIAQRYYNISTAVRWIFDIKNPRRAFTLLELATSKMDEMFVNRIFGPSVPQYWSPYGWDETTGERIIEIYPPGDTTYRLEATGYSGVTEPSLNSSPHRDINERILMEGALADAFRFRASKEQDIIHVRTMLDVAMSHEKRYDSLLEGQRKRDVLDAPAPRTRLIIQRRDSYANGLYDPIVTAQDEVWSRSPAIGNN